MKHKSILFVVFSVNVLFALSFSNTYRPISEINNYFIGNWMNLNISNDSILVKIDFKYNSIIKVFHISDTIFTNKSCYTGDTLEINKIKYDKFRLKYISDKSIDYYYKDGIVTIQRTDVNGCCSEPSHNEQNKIAKELHKIHYKAIIIYISTFVIIGIVLNVFNVF